MPGFWYAFNNVILFNCIILLLLFVFYIKNYKSPINRNSIVLILVHGINQLFTFRNI